LNEPRNIDLTKGKENKKLVGTKIKGALPTKLKIIKLNLLRDTRHTYRFFEKVLRYLNGRSFPLVELHLAFRLKHFSYFSEQKDLVCPKFTGLWETSVPNEF
jgi:hypothetical protein